MSPVERSVAVAPETEPHRLIALLVPGQGKQRVGMGWELWQRYPPVKELFSLASEVTGQDVARLCFEGPEGELNKPENAQTAILINHQANLIALQKEGKLHIEDISLVAGHSLGELSGLVPAGAISVEDLLILGRERGKGTQIAYERHPSRMVALKNPSEEIRKLLQTLGVQVCITNTDNLVTFGGLEKAIAEAKRLLTEKKIPFAEVNVAGAFHTKWMKPAVEYVVEALRRIHIRDARIPLVANTTGKLIQTRDQIEKEIIAQLTEPVQWDKTIAHLKDQQTDETIEIGENNHLSKWNTAMIGGGITVITIAGITLASIWRRHHQAH